MEKIEYERKHPPDNRVMPTEIEGWNMIFNEGDFSLTLKAKKRISWRRCGGFILSAMATGELFAGSADYCCNIGTIVNDVRRHFESKKCCYEICGGIHLIKSVSRVKRHEFVSDTLTFIPH